MRNKEVNIVLYLRLQLRFYIRITKYPFNYLFVSALCYSYGEQPCFNVVMPYCMSISHK